MSWDWKSALKTVAPLLGNAIGGPVGASALSFVSKALLGKPDGSEEEIAEAMKNATPEQVVALTKANNDFKEHMAEIGLKEKQLVFDDRSDARQLFKTNIWPQIVISAIFIIGYFTVLGFLISGGIKIDPAVNTLVVAVVGTLTAGVVQIMNFWFGSSSGSKDKTHIMGNKQ